MPNRRITNLVATFTLSPEANATIGATPQVTAVTVNDFTNTVQYTITAGDGSTGSWQVHVTVAGI